MPNHQASEQMLGYLYQVRYALALLLENDNSDFQISIEKFDDVAFSKDGMPKQLIQLKHHIQRQGSLTDGSTDLWRTLKVWIDVLSDSPDILDGTEFLIVTTAIAPDGTAASYLKKGENRNAERAYEKLKDVCLKSENKDHKKYYDSFLKTDESTIKHLISQICVIDGASDIIDVEKNFRKQIRYSCIPKYENQICERLEGWWYKKAIEALCSGTPIFVTQSQVRSFIVSVSQEYSDDNLPIDIFDIGNLQEDDLSANEKIFYEAQKKRGSISREKKDVTLKNPFAGIMVCGRCGAAMIMKKYTDKRNKNNKDATYILCSRQSVCHTKSVKYSKISEIIKDSLLCILPEFEIDMSVCRQKENCIDVAIDSILNNIHLMKKKDERQKDAYENGIYSKEEYKLRNEELQSQIKKAEEMVENERERQKELLLYKEKKLYFNDCIKLIDNQNIDAAKMNHFLKSFISKIEYYDNSFNDMNKYNLKIYLKI
jgi:hypothetical protein